MTAFEHDRSGNADAFAAEADELRRGWPEAEALLRKQAAAADGPEAHPDLDALRALVRARREQGEAWDMPEHLATCPLCLEVFEILLAGVPEPSPPTLDRYAAIVRAGSFAPQPRPRFRWAPWLKAAAVFALLLAGGILLDQTTRRTSASVTRGWLYLAGDQVVPAGFALPGRTLLHATARTTASFADGSRLEIAPDTALALRELPFAGQLVDLRVGEVDFNVAKHDARRPFAIRTRLGDVIVVGTRFRVACRGEKVAVFENQGATGHRRSYTDVISTVIVTVMEGRVRVRNRHEEVRIGAGQRAVLRARQPMIEVTGVGG